MLYTSSYIFLFFFCTVDMFTDNRDIRCGLFRSSELVSVTNRAGAAQSTDFNALIKMCDIHMDRSGAESTQKKKTCRGKRNLALKHK